MPFKREPRPIPGRIVTFLIGRTDHDLTATEVVDIKALKSAPGYPDVIPKQKVIKLERRLVVEKEVVFLVKAYPPHIVVVEASLDRDDMLASDALEIKNVHSSQNAEKSWRSSAVIFYGRFQGRYRAVRDRKPPAFEIQDARQ